MDDLRLAGIAQKLGLSTAKGNQLLRQALDQGMVEIRIKIPSHKVYEMEQQIEKRYDLREAVVIAGFTKEEANLLQNVSEAAASCGDEKCGGSTTISQESVQYLRS